MTWSSRLPARPSGITSYLPFSALSEPLRCQWKVRKDLRNFRWIFGIQDRFINREFDKLLKVFFTTNCLQQQQMMESLGLILHRIEIFIQNVILRFRTQLFWTATWLLYYSSCHGKYIPRTMTEEMSSLMNEPNKLMWLYILTFITEQRNVSRLYTFLAAKTQLYKS